jgi:indole-3-acetate monooxygenase
VAIEIDTGANVVETAREFAPMLRERADEIEQTRHLPQDIADQFAKAGLYRMLVPEMYGGLEVSPVRFLDVVESLATADGSAAWCVFIGATSGLVSAYIPETTARELFEANPEVILAGVFAPRGFAVPEDGGYRVNGEWQWGSGSRNADWIAGGCVTIRDGSPELIPGSRMPLSRMMIAPRKRR